MKEREMHTAADTSKDFLRPPFLVGFDADDGILRIYEYFEIVEAVHYHYLKNSLSAPCVVFGGHLTYLRPN
jgi:hypothetical protein